MKVSEIKNHLNKIPTISNCIIPLGKNLQPLLITRY